MDEIHRPDHGHFCSAPAFTSDSPGSTSDWPRHFDDDEKIYLKPSLHLDTETAKNGFRPAIAFLPVRTPGEKIRRLYRQRILKHFSQKTAGILPRWASPSELEETCGMDQPALHELYEKARYGNVPCTREDLEQLKKSK